MQPFRDLVPIISTLEYNDWFTKVTCDSFKLVSDIRSFSCMHCLVKEFIKKRKILQEAIEEQNRAFLWHAVNFVSVWSNVL